MCMSHKYCSLEICPLVHIHYSYDIFSAFVMNYNGFSTELQVLTYNDVLYLELNQQDPVNNKLYNGGIDAMAFITGKYPTLHFY